MSHKIDPKSIIIIIIGEQNTGSRDRNKVQNFDLEA